jgi:hypothetical protein
MKEKIGIIQPGRLGDIVILLPAAKYLHDQGFEVVWPIFREYVSMFSEVVNYVKFIPVSNNVYTCVNEAYAYFVANGIQNIKDVAATFPGSECTEEYVKCGDGLLDEKFDQFKYRLLDVPFDQKWNLTILRNENAEDELYNKYVTTAPYVVTALKHSKGRINVNLDTNGRSVVEVNDHHNIFHWLKILKNADVLALAESSLSNIVEQLNLPNKKFLFRKPDGRLPVLRNNWTII